MPPKLAYSNDSEPVVEPDPEMLASIQKLLKDEDYMRAFSLHDDDHVVAFALRRYPEEVQKELPYQIDIWRKHCTDTLKITPEGGLDTVSRKFRKASDPNLANMVPDLRVYREAALDLLDRVRMEGRSARVEPVLQAAE